MAFMQDRRHQGPGIEVVDDAVAKVLRTKTPAERILMMGEAWRSAMAWMVGVIGSMHPGWDSEQIISEIIRILHGRVIRK